MLEFGLIDNELVFELPILIKDTSVVDSNNVNNTRPKNSLRRPLNANKTLLYAFSIRKVESDGFKSRGDLQIAPVELLIAPY